MWNCGDVGRLLSNFSWFTNLFLSHAALLILSSHPCLSLHFLWGFLRTRRTQCPPVSAHPPSSASPLLSLLLPCSSPHLSWAFSSSPVSSAHLPLALPFFPLCLRHCNAKPLCIAGIPLSHIWAPEYWEERAVPLPHEYYTGREGWDDKWQKIGPLHRGVRRVNRARWPCGCMYAAHGWHIWISRTCTRMYNWRDKSGPALMQVYI